MRLATGTRLGPYEILAPLGAGGMGEVYKARDTRLDRDVAVKILSPDTAASPEARQRFEREARTISQLSHPHICAIFDVGETSNPESPIANPYLVMELLEGETLAEHLASGPLPLELTLRFATQIADALDKAHRQGIVHRDLKPANVMITKAGVKLLDFGLAKAVAPLGSSPSLSVVETTPPVPPLTASGAIAGTVQYMAPEQLAGKPADARSDIYAFGAVLYEMATGQRAFGTAPKPVAPPALDRLVRTCMAADPDERWQSAHDVRLHLDAVADQGPSQAPPAHRVARRWLPWTVAAAAVVVGMLLGMRSLRTSAPAAASTARFAIPPPDGGTFVSHVETLSLALSPDGSQLAFVASDRNGGPRLWLRKMSSLDATAVAGTNGSPTMSMFWSPDGRSIGFFSGGKLKRLDVQSGGIVTICAVQENIGLFGTWGRDGRILFASVEGSAIFAIAVGGGTPAEVIRPDRSAGEARLTWPWFLPDGERFLYTVRLIDGRARVMLAEPGKPPRQVLTAVSNVQYADPGYLVFASESTLVAQRFDVSTGRVVGEAFAVGQPVRYFYSTASAVFTVSRTGTLVYQSHDDESRLLWHDRAGAEAGAVAAPGVFQLVRLSPDGNALVFDRARGGAFDLWRADLTRGVESRLTQDAGSEFSGVWHPDGRTLFFSADRRGPPHLFRRDLKSGAETEVLPSLRFQQPEDVSPDGRTLVYAERSAAGTFDLWTVPVNREAPPARLFDTPADETGARFSPDGRWLTFVSNESGAPEVYATAFPPTGERTRVSVNGGGNARWSRDGAELFYMSSARQLVSVPVRRGPSLALGTATILFTVKGLSWRDYDVSVDGKRFLADVPQRPADQQPLTAVLNWPAEGAASAGR